MDIIEIIGAAITIGGAGSSPWWLPYLKGILTVNARYTEVLEKHVALSGRVETLENENATLKSNADKSQATIDGLISQVRNQDRTIELLHKELADRDIKIDDIQKRATEQISELEKRSQDQQEQISQQAERLDAQTKDKEQLAREKAEALEQLREVNQALAITKMKADTLESALEVLRNIKSVTASEHKDQTPEVAIETSEETL